MDRKSVLSYLKLQNLIQDVFNDGAECVLNRRHIRVEKYPNDYFVGFTILNNGSVHNTAYIKATFVRVLVSCRSTFLEMRRWMDGIKSTHGEQSHESNAPPHPTKRYAMERDT